MRAIWKGAISFGLINIPISLYPATRREELHFHFLRKSDLSPVNYKRVAEKDGKEVPWDQVVKGFEYEKGRYVVLSDEDFTRADVKATQTVDIVNFVRLDEINPLLFYKPYFMESGKGGDKAYALLREALKTSSKVAIAKVVLKTRQHLAAVKPQGKGLMLELMHFTDEMLEPSEFKMPAAGAASPAETKMAMQLVDSMTAEWAPQSYKDDYRLALKKMIKERVDKGEARPTSAASVPKVVPTKVVDLFSVLKRSIEEAQTPHQRKSLAHKSARTSRRKAA